MTPQRAAPEQLRGEPVTTATDVWALGLLLHELLVGELPPSPEARAAGETLPQDLAAVVRHATSPRPDERYAAAGPFADDVQRWLDGEPVRARRHTVRYRAGKFLHRHRLGVAAVATIAASMLVGLALALVGLVRAQRAEQRALDEAATSSQISEFLVDLFQANDPAESRGNAVTARELLDRGRERIDERLTDQPAVRARLLRSMGGAYEALGLFDPAQELIDEELDLEIAHYGAGSAEVRGTLIELADLHSRKGDYAGALELGRRALALFEPSSADTEALSRTLTQIGRAHAELGQLAEAEAALERSLAVIEQDLGSDHGRLRSPLNNLAILSWMQGDIDTAMRRYERAIAIGEADLGPEHPSIAHLLNNLALAHQRAGDFEQAVATHRRALAIRQKVLEPDHVDLAESLNNLGSSLHSTGENSEAQRLLERALAIRESALGADHVHTASTLTNLGNVAIARGEPEAARSALERSLEVFERVLAHDHASVSYPLIGLAELDAESGDTASAERRFTRALSVREARLGQDHPDFARARRKYAEFLRGQGRGTEAEELERQAEPATPPTR